MPLDFETSEIAGLSLRCPTGCAYCCLCPPGLLEGEDDILVGKCGCDGNCIGKDNIGNAERGVKVQGQGGACVFLEEKKCRFYDSRPHFCRQYPLMVYSGWRLQISAIRSCRGLCNNGTGEGRPLMGILKNEVSVLSEDYFLDTLEETRGSFNDLKDQVKIFNTVEKVQENALKVADMVGDARSLARTAGLGEGNEVEMRRSLLDAFWNEIVPAFSGPDMMELPVYPSPDLSWKIFRLVGDNEISGYGLDPTGRSVYLGTRTMKDLELLDLEMEGVKALRSYLTLAFRRDVFYGMVAREAMIEERMMDEVATWLASKTALDLWWRACLLKSFTGDRKGKIGGSEAREAIIFMDADLLDAFAFGAVI